MRKNKINLTTFVIILSSLLLNSCNLFHPSNNIKNLSWICGTYSGTSNGLQFYQEWNFVSDSMLIGLNYSFCNGEKVVNDSSTIKVVNDEIVYSSNKSNWKLEISTDQACKFSNEAFNESVYFSKKDSILNVKLDFPSKKIDYALKLISNSKKEFTIEKKFLVGSFDGYLNFKNKKQFLTLNFDTLNGIQKATITSSNYFLYQKEINSICYNHPNLFLSFQDLGQNLQLNLLIHDSILTGSFQSKQKADVFLSQNSRQTTSNSDISFSTKSLSDKNGELQISIASPINTEIKSTVILISQHSGENFNGWAEIFARNKIEFIICNNLSNNENIDSKLNTIINYIKSKNKSSTKIGLIDFGSIFNEGLTNAANNKELSFYVSISNQFISNKEKVLEEAKSSLLKNNVDNSYLNAANDVWNALFEYANKRSNEDLIKNMLRQANEEGWGKYCLPAKIPSNDELNNSPFWKTINDDPSYSINTLAIPTLVVYGEHDAYLNVKLNAERINQLFKNKSKLLSIRIYGNTDHYLKSSNHPEHLWATYDEDFIQQTIQWISSISK